MLCNIIEYKVFHAKYGEVNWDSVVLQVDISTMLEEAVQYVKFLQLQIKVIKKKRRRSKKSQA